MKKESSRQILEDILLNHLEPKHVLITMDYLSRKVAFSGVYILSPEVVSFVSDALERDKIENLNFILRACPTSVHFMGLAELIYASSTDGIIIRLSSNLLDSGKFMEFAALIYNLDRELFEAIYQRRRLEYPYIRDTVKFEFHLLSDLARLIPLSRPYEEIVTSCYEMTLRERDCASMMAEELAYIKEAGERRSILFDSLFKSTALSPAFSYIHMNVLRHCILNEVIDDINFTPVVDLLFERDLIDRLAWMAMNCTFAQALRIRLVFKNSAYKESYSRMFDSVERDIAELRLEDEKYHREFFSSLAQFYFPNCIVNIVHGYYYELDHLDGVCYNQKDLEFMVPILKVQDPVSV